jgi:outer membrane protein OmpA-like peptidoglycan-associated protein
MKRMNLILAPSALVLAALAGCASNPPPTPTELQNARTAVKKVESGPSAQANPSGVIEARQALDAAETAYADDPKGQEAKTLGYVAQRKAEIAAAEGRTTMAMQAESAKEEAALGRSERRAKAALDRLGLAAKEEKRGTVITLPTSNMFAVNQSEIKPDAEKKLADIAKAVKKVQAEKAPADQNRRIELIGYTDDTGSDEHNLDLSKKRAEAVRTFFSKHGLDPALIDVDGKGEADPVADNKTPQGRAKNRRVEIVVTPPAAPSPG